MTTILWIIWIINVVIVITLVIQIRNSRRIAREIKRNDEYINQLLEELKEKP